MCTYACRPWWLRDKKYYFSFIVIYRFVRCTNHVRAFETGINKFNNFTALRNKQIFVFQYDLTNAPTLKNLWLPAPPPHMTHYLDITSYLTQCGRNSVNKICSSFYEFKHRVACEYPFYEPKDTHLILFRWPFVTHLPLLLLYNRKFLVHIRKIWWFFSFSWFLTEKKSLHY
jgi:hypothetical protein